MNTLVTHEITVPPISMLIGQGYIQHAGGGSKETHSLRYHVYLTPDTYGLPDATEFPYSSRMGVDPENGVETSTVTVKVKELYNVEDSYDGNDSDSSREETSGTDDDDSDNECISGDDSRDDVRGWRVESVSIPEKWCNSLCVSCQSK